MKFGRFFHHFYSKQGRSRARMRSGKKVALITGGSFGIGMNLAKFLAEDSVLISICDVDQDGGEELVAELNKKHGDSSAIFTKCDVSNRDALRSVFVKTKNHFGRIDIVVNNAGFFNDSDQVWESSVDVNVKGLISGSLLALDFMGADKGNDGGLVINVASVLGYLKYPCMPIYSATKAAALMFTRNMGNEIHYSTTKVKFIAICPHGSIGSHFLEKMSGRFIRPEVEEHFHKTEDLNRFQTVEHVAQCIARISKKAENGSVWLIEHGEEEKQITFVDPKIHGI